MLDEFIQAPTENPADNSRAGNARARHIRAPFLVRLPSPTLVPGSQLTSHTTSTSNIHEQPAYANTSSTNHSNHWRQYRAPIDSLADVSCINPEAVRALGASIIPPPSPQVIRLAAKGMSVPRLGTVRLHIRCGAKNFLHNFDVMDMEDAFIFGLDIFKPIGIYTGGVPTHFPGASPGEEAAKVAAAREAELAWRQKPWSLAHEHSEDQLRILRHAINPLLQHNAAIDAALPACSTLPQSVLHIPMEKDLQGSRTYRRQFPVPKAARGATDKQFLKWSQQHCFEPADPASDFNSPYIAVGKKDLDGLKTEWRICMDLRHINALLSREGYANGRVPRIEELLERASGFTHATCLDLSAAYQQLPIAEADRHKTAFTYNNKRLQWKRWPFGLTPCTAQFQKVMELVLADLDGVFVYVDDCAILTKGSMEEHAQVVAEVLRRFNFHGLRLNLDKCHFGFKTVTVLGHQLSQQERSIDPVKLRQAIDWPLPKSGKDIMKFLGFTNYLRSYIPNYNQLSNPLDAVRFAKALTLDGSQLAAFHALKGAINSAPVLSAPDDSLPLLVATDASQSGLGAVLYQQAEGSDVIRYIAFASKSLDGAQKNYPATKRELLGIVFALRAFSHWLLGTRFVLYTDHQALTTMFTNPKQSYTIFNWMDILLEYDFEVRHRPGIQMLMPDSLSRLYPASDADDLPGDRFALRSMLAVRALSTIENPVAPDKELREFIKERLGKKSLLSVEEQTAKLRAVHAAAHLGAEHLFKHVWREGYFWPGMRQQCEDIVHSCHSCLAFNIRRAGFHPTRSLVADNPWDHIAVDCAVDLPVSQHGNAAILILVDVASRFVVTRPLPNTQEHTVARALFEIFAAFGPPKILQSDRGSEFINGVLKKLVAAAGIDHRLVAPYNPQANGIAERHVKTIKDALKKKLEGQYDRWDDALPAATWAINTKEHDLTRTAPFTLFFGRAAGAWEDYSVQQLALTRSDSKSRATAAPDPKQVQDIVNKSAEFARLVRDPVREIVRAGAQKNNAALDDKRPLADSRICPGALVYIIDQDRDSKWDPINLGPFLVDRQSKRSLSFYLRNISNDTVLVRPFPIHHLAFAADTNSVFPITKSDGSELTALPGKEAISEILQQRSTEDGSSEYQVRWKDKKRKNSWLSASQIEMGFLGKFVRKDRPFKKGKLPTRTAKKRSAYSY